MKLATDQIPSLDPEAVRADFPILQTRVGGKPLVYLDNAATTQKPAVVIEALNRFYREENANIHRGVHYLSQKATDLYEDARSRVAGFLNASSPEEIVFVRGATEAINLVAHSFGAEFFSAGDEIVISHLEHHSNIVPWQLLAERLGLKLRVIPIDDRGDLDMEAFNGLLNDNTRLVAVGHISNALGTINPVEKMIERAHARGVPLLLDGAQSAAHIPIDVQALDCDFFVFSSHKVFGPTGVGALYAKRRHLAAMTPYQGGGDMIARVTFEKTTYKEPPSRFEAGTPHIAGAVGLAVAVNYVETLGREAIAAYESGIVEYAVECLGGIPGLQLIGTPRRRAGVVSFLMEGVHPHDIGTVLDGEGVAIRAGHHCAQPLMKRLGVAATARASFAFYNTRAEVESLAAALGRVRTLFT